MTELLSRLFVRDWENTDDPIVRSRYGQMAGIVGILLNVLLFISKYCIGVLTASIAICADAVNNLSDAGSSIISLIAFRISAKPADREHPYGHARVEYVASMIVSFGILYIGIGLLRDSIDKILHPSHTAFHPVTLIVLLLSILGKLWLYLFNKKIGKKIGSTVMEANAADSLSDVITTSSVLLSTLVLFFLHFDIDGYIGVLVAVFICVSGLKILNETKNYIIGQSPDRDLVDAIKEIVHRHPEALGIHDLMIHSYGPGRYFTSLHVEVDGSADIFVSHDMIDSIENELKNELHLHATIHMDPIVCNDPKVAALRCRIEALAIHIDASLSIHDFRMVPGITHTNLVFDLVVPFECKRTDTELQNDLALAIATLDPKYHAIIQVERQ